ncbi:MAG: chorismate--pyruvate lyase [Oleispira sp.]
MPLAQFSSMLRAMKHQSIISQFLSQSFPSWSARNKREAFTVPLNWRTTLFNTGSLTAQLIAISDGDFSVQVLWQGWRKLSQQEALLLGCAGNQQIAWCRDVVLKVQGKPRVYARTCMPKSTLTGNECQLKNWGSKSLGTYLFKHPHMRRGEMSAYRIPNNELSLSWARRSVFYLQQKPILVTEAFTLPLPTA